MKNSLLILVFVSTVGAFAAVFMPEISAFLDQVYRFGIYIMTVIVNWRRVLRKTWSVRFIILASALSVAEVATPILGEGRIETGYFAALSGISTVGAFVARIVAQKEFENER